MNPYLTITLFIQLVAEGFAFAQSDLRFWHITSSEGLSGKYVHSILQDSTGYIWFGTDGGLSRYDSRNFVNYKNKTNDTTSIAGNKVSKIILDHHQQMWLITDGGLCRFNIENKKFVRYGLYNNKEKIKNINDIFFDVQQNLWVATEGEGWGYFDQKNNSYKRQQFSSTDSADQLRKIYNAKCITSDKQGDLYLGTLAYSLVVKRNNKFTITNPKQKNFPFPAHTINTIFCDSRNNIWIGAWDNALHQYNKVSNLISTIFLDDENNIDFSGNEIIAISEDINGLLWIGTSRKGLFIYNPETGKAINYVHNYFDKSSISSNHINTIFRDKDYRMWIGTENGVDIYDPLINQFEIHYVSKNANQPELVNDFLFDDTTFFIASHEGLWVKRGEKKMELKSFRYKGEQLNITDLFKDSYGTIYIGTNKSVFILDKKTLSLKEMATIYNRPANANFNFYNIASSRIVSMAQSKCMNREMLWVSPFGHGICGFDLNTKTGFVTSLFEGKIRMEHLVNHFFVDSKQSVFCLTKHNSISLNFKGYNKIENLLMLPLTNNKTVLKDFDPIQTTFLNHTIKNLPDDVYDMIESNTGSYWFTSPSSGLYSLTLNGITGNAIHYENDFPNTYGMAQDENKNLWMISSDGIEFFDTQKKQFQHFGNADGLPTDGLHRYFYKDNNGFLYAGGKGLYIKFKPEAIRFNINRPKAVINHFKIFDSNADSLLTNHQIDLSYLQNHFSFEFAALNFTNSSANQFAYMLEGVDKEWIYSGIRNFTSYTNLDGGQYQFKVKAANNNGVWGNAATINIYIKPPFWQYAWFFPLVILLTGITGFLIYRRRIKNIHRVQTDKMMAEINAQEKERRRIARDLHDEFGTKMSALKIYLSTFEKFIDHRNEEATKTKKELYAIVDDSMHDLRSLLMDLSPKTLEMHGFGAALIDLTNRLNQTHLFTINCYVTPELEKFDGRYELTVFRIVQELINNSIKHSGCKTINIQLFYRDHSIVLNYDDDGKGFDTEKIKSAGYGLKNIETRAALLNGKVNWESTAGSGINVLVTIPYIK